jgi:type I restriction enzyme S subunit
MGSDWPKVRLGDHIETCLGKMLDKKKNEGSFHPYLVNKSVRWGSFNLEELSEMRFQDHEHEKYGLRCGDLVVCEGGEPGRCAIWKDEVPNMKFQKALHRIRPKDELDVGYLFYWLTFNAKVGRLDAFFTGTTIKHLTGRALVELDVELPPVRVQKSIAHILGTLDDKIELNRRMNETLESMARALFKSWFVDFDPVIDNALAAGNPIPEPLSQRAQTRRDLGTKRKPLPKNIQKLFPDSFVFDEQLGWIPDGWETEPVYEVAQFINGAAFKSSHFCAKEDGLPVVKIAELKNGISAQTKFTDRDMDDKYSIDSGEVLFSWSGSPDTSIDTFVWSGGAGWLNQHIFKVSFHRASERGFVYFMLKHLKPTFVEIARDKQTTGLGHVTARDMKRLFVVKPIESLPEHFATYVDPVLQRAFASSMQSKRLTKLRDTLLPKLLSGELRIPDAEKLVASSL